MISIIRAYQHRTRPSCLYATILSLPHYVFEVWDHKKKRKKKLLSCSNSKPGLDMYRIACARCDTFSHICFIILLLEPTRHENLSSYAANFQSLPAFIALFWFLTMGWGAKSSSQELRILHRTLQPRSSFPPHTSLGLTRFIARRVLRGRFTLLLTHFSWLIQFQLDMMRKWIRRPSFFFCTQPTTMMLKFGALNTMEMKFSFCCEPTWRRLSNLCVFFSYLNWREIANFISLPSARSVHALENVNEISTPTFLTPAN